MYHSPPRMTIGKSSTTSKRLSSTHTHSLMRNERWNMFSTVWLRNLKHWTLPSSLPLHAHLAYFRMCATSLVRSASRGTPNGPLRNKTRRTKEHSAFRHARDRTLLCNTHKLKAFPLCGYAHAVVGWWDRRSWNCCKHNAHTHMFLHTTDNRCQFTNTWQVHFALPHLCWHKMYLRSAIAIPSERF